MKAPAKAYRIVTPDRGRTWRIERKSDGEVVWSGASFREARSQHAARELDIDIKTARRMGNG